MKARSAIRAARQRAASSKAIWHRNGAAGLDQMVADAKDAGLYDLPTDVPFERLPVEGDGE